jgi:uncharacterized protein
MKYKNELENAIVNREDTKKLFQKFKKSKPKKLDEQFHKLHEQTFRSIDCLDCANCCKTTSPIFRDIDIKRISKKMKMSESNFISNYLKMDEEKDYVLQSSPCYFLDDDNACSIYEIRPLACREYPHTDRKNMFQILDLTLKNTEVCPAVSQIVSKMLDSNSTQSKSK